MDVRRVQALAFEGGIKELPAQFVRLANERPDNSKALEGVKVPVISMQQQNDVLVKEVSWACSEWGFFLLTDHGFPPSLVPRLQEVGEEFFKLPQEEKEKYANDPSAGKFDGYGTKMTKNHDEKLEWIDYFFHHVWPPAKLNYAIWPQNPPAYKEVNEEYAKEALKVTDRVLELLSEGLLGLEGKKIMKSILGGEEIELEMKINMYPPFPQPELALGVEPHTEMSAITILVPNNVPGLQVWKDGNWVAVDYVPNSLLFHIGDQIEVISNGKYKSVLHRSVVNKDRMRMSWAVFCCPPTEAVIGPHPLLLNEQNPAKFSTKTYGEYRYLKFNKLPQ